MDQGADLKPMARLAVHPHGFATGTTSRPGRLILRNILSHELSQYKRILTDPKNSYPGQQSFIRRLSDSQLESHFAWDYKVKHQLTYIYIILKPGYGAEYMLDPSDAFRFKGNMHVIGFISLMLSQHDRRSTETSAEIGIVLHHQATRHGFSKEVMIAVLDYVLLGQPAELSNGYLGGLGLRQAIIETGKENHAMRGLMKSLYLKSTERPGKQGEGTLGQANIPFVVYKVRKDKWLEARKEVANNTPAGQQPISRRDEVLNYHALPAPYSGDVYGYSGGPGYGTDSRYATGGQGSASGYGYAPDPGYAPGSGYSSSGYSASPDQRYQY